MDHPVEPLREDDTRANEQGLETARGTLIGIFGGCVFWLLLVAVIAGIYAIQIGTS